MAVLDITRPALSGAAGTGRAFNFIRAGLIAFADWRARTATRRSLMKLSDHQLSDIGLERGDVERMTYRIMH